MVSGEPAVISHGFRWVNQLGLVGVPLIMRGISGGRDNQLYTKGIQIQEMPVSSDIMEPLNKQVVIHNGKISVKGWAEVVVGLNELKSAHMEVMYGTMFHQNKCPKITNLRGEHGISIYLATPRDRLSLPFVVGTIRSTHN